MGRANDPIPFFVTKNLKFGLSMIAQQKATSQSLAQSSKSERTSTTEHQQSLIEELHKLPTDWVLTLVDGDKAAYRVGWQTESPLSFEQLCHEITSGNAKGYGLRTGTISGGLVAIDADGHSAHEKILELSGGEPLPETVAFTSNRAGRCQYLFKVSQEYWDAIKTTKIKTGVAGDDGKPEQLELRWNGLQSVLPPSAHPKTGFYRWRKSPQEVEIAPAPMWLIEQMLIEKPQQEPHLPLLGSQRPVTSYTSKSRTGKEWSDEEWALSYLYALQPYRADDYDFWIKVGMALHSIGDSLFSVWDRWSQQSSKYKPGECDKKWKSFKKGKIGIEALGKMAKEDGWRSPFEKPSGRAYSSSNLNQASGSSSGDSGSGGVGGDGDDKNGNVITHPNFIPTSDELLARIDKLIAQQITGSKLTAHLNRLAAKFEWHVVELRKLYYERKGETEQTEEQVEAQSLLPNLLEVHKLDLRECLWGDEGALAEAMIETAKAMPTNPDFMFSTLLSTAATLIGTSSRIIIKAKGKYKQPSIFQVAVVSRSGTLKTPVQGVIIDPLIKLEAKAYEEYQAQLEQYDIHLANWKKKGADLSLKPKLPVRKRYITKDATIETLERIHGENPRGILVYRDELAEDFKANNAYRNGKGGDAEKKLDQWNGSPIIVDRKERQIMIERSAVSRTGSIQLEVLQSLNSDGRDDNGTFARWLFCVADAPLRFINLLEEDVDTGIEELLTHLYQRLEKMPERDYLLSDEAKRLFQEWQHSLVKAEINETHPGLQVVYPKIEAYTARFALWLHIVNAALAGETPSAVIDEGTMRAAINLAKYYLQNAKVVLTINSPQSGLTGVLLKIQKYAQGKPNGVKIYKLRSAVRDLRNTSKEELLSHCSWLSDNGHGAIKDGTYFVDKTMTTIGLLSTPDFKAVSANSIDDLLTKQSPPVNIANTINGKGSRVFVDKNDKNDNPNHTIPVTELNKASSVELYNRKSPISLEVENSVNTVINSGETYTESGVDTDQQSVNNRQFCQQTESANSTSADEVEEVAQVEATAPEPAEVEEEAPVQSPLPTYQLLNGNYGIQSITLDSNNENQSVTLDRVDKSSPKSVVAQETTQANVDANESEEAITPSPVEVEIPLPIYQRSDGTIHVDSSELDDSFNPPVVTQQIESSDVELTTPAITSLEQLIDCLADVTTKEEFETVTVGQSLEMIQDAIVYQDTPIQRQHLRALMNLR